MPFRPKPNEVIPLLGKKLTFEELPTAPGILFSSEGGRAFVYRVHDERRNRFALKVFKAKFRNSRVIDGASHLQTLTGYPGMLAARREIVRPTEPVVTKYRDLEYAVLMPWVPGKTWFDCLQSAETRGAIYGVDQARAMSSHFLDVVAGLEKDTIAHTDISAANVMVQDRLNTELLDLEEMYLRGAPEPNPKTIGTKGYQHRAARPTWRPDGDRFAAAVLATEMLLLSEEGLARRATSNGYFSGNCAEAEAERRFQDARYYLRDVSKDFAMHFESAWYSDELSRCPTVEQLLAGLAKQPIIVQTPEFQPDVPSVSWQPLQPAPVTNSSDLKTPLVTWQQFPPQAKAQAAAAAVASTSRPANTSAFWSTTAAVADANSATFGATGAAGTAPEKPRRVILIAVIVLVLLFLFVLLVASVH